MYLKYVTNTTSVLSEVLSDLAALAAGADISALSASCNKGTSQLLANIDAPGWTLLDAAGPTSSKVLTAKDLSGADKVIALVPSGATGFAVCAYDTYNPATHTGINITPIGTKLNYSATVSNTYNLLVNARRLLITNNTGDTVVGSIEFAREAAYLSNLGYPSHAAIVDQNSGQGFNFVIPRVKSMIASGDYTTSTTNTSCGLMAVGYPTSYNVGAPNTAPTTMRDAGDSIYHQMLPSYAGLHYPSLNNVSGWVLGRIADVFLGTNGAGNALDTTTDGTDTYLILGMGVGTRALFKLG